MIYGYVRYQKNDEESKKQQEQLLKESGAEKIFYDTGSGYDLRRKGLEELLSAAKSGDTIIATRYTKLVRKFPEARIMLDEIIKKNVVFKEVQGKLDTSDPAFLELHKTEMEFFEELEKRYQEVN